MPRPSQTTTCPSYAAARDALDRGATSVTLTYVGAHLDLPELEARAPSVEFDLFEPPPASLWWAPTERSSRQLVEGLAGIAAREPDALVVLANDPASYAEPSERFPTGVVVKGPETAAAWGPRARASVRQWGETRPRRELYPSYASTLPDSLGDVGLGDLHVAYSVEDALELLPHLKAGVVVYLDFLHADATVAPLAAAQATYPVSLATLHADGHWYARHGDGTTCWVASP
jgi:hypothetical protein